MLVAYIGSLFARTDMDFSFEGRLVGYIGLLVAPSVLLFGAAVLLFAPSVLLFGAAIFDFSPLYFNKSIPIFHLISFIQINNQIKIFLNSIKFVL